MNDIIDIHNHILPGIDDGSENLGETSVMLSQACKDGIKAVLATPHYHPGRKKADVWEIRQAFEKVREMVSKKNLDIRIYLGNEIFYHDSIVEDLNAEKILTMNETGYVLIEFYPEHPYSYIRQGLNRIVSEGYIPVVAHAERYTELLGHDSYVEELTEMGCYIQLNAESVIGGHGMKTKAFCKKLLKNDLVHFIATDAHHATGSRTVKLQKCAAYIEKKYGSDYAKKIFRDNPSRLLEGADI